MQTFKKLAASALAAAAVTAALILPGSAAQAGPGDRAATSAARPSGAKFTSTEISDLTQLSAVEMAAATPATTASPGSGLSTSLAYDPWTSPRARDVRETNSSAPSCFANYVCQKVPKSANCGSCGMREFLFFYFDLYSVFDWHENGKFNNRQEDGASYRTYRSNGSMIGCARAGRAGTNVLEPIFYVLLSPTPC
jgi:hypothetical protein